MFRFIVGTDVAHIIPSPPSINNCWLLFSIRQNRLQAPGRPLVQLSRYCRQFVYVQSSARTPPSSICRIIQVILSHPATMESKCCRLRVKKRASLERERERERRRTTTTTTTISTRYVTSIISWFGNRCHYNHSNEWRRAHIIIISIICHVLGTHPLQILR